MGMKKADRKDLIKECGDACCILFEYWLSVSGYPNHVLTDAGSAKSIGWDTSKAKRIRLKLTKHGYFQEEKWPARPDGKRIVLYHIGKKNVASGMAPRIVELENKLTGVAA